MPSDKELLALAEMNGALNAGDWRGLILWQHGQGNGLLGFARELLATSTDDSALLDHIQCTGSTVELLPGNRFRIGGLHAAVSTDLRAAIRIAVGADGVTAAPAPIQPPRLRDALLAVRWDKSFNNLKERTQEVVKAALTDGVSGGQHG